MKLGCDIYIYIYMPVTSFGGLLGVPRWDETAGNKEKQGEKDKKIDKEESKNTRKTATILWLSFRAILNNKTGNVFKIFACFGPTK